MVGHICRFNPRYAAAKSEIESGALGKIVSSHASRNIPAAVSKTERALPHSDLGWTMFRFSTGAVGVCENVWYLPEKTPYRIDERMEIIGTDGAIYIQDSPASISVCDRDGWRSPDTTYWPLVHGERAGALRDEFAYFAQCILDGRKPSVITPEEAMREVEACLAAERSASTGQVVPLVRR